MKLLIYLRIIFLQDSTLFRTNYFLHFLWRHEIFNHFLYASFVINVLSRFENKDRNLNSQVRTIISILNQQMFNLNSSLNVLIIENFEKQQKQSVKIESKLNDFLNDKIAFIMTSMKRRKFLDVNTKKAFILIDSQFQKVASTFFFVFFISSSRFKSISFVFFFKRASFLF